MAQSPTHDNSGTIHVESSLNGNYTMDDFSRIWGMNLNGKYVNVSVDGKPIFDYRYHILKDNEQNNLNIASKK